MSVLPVSVSPAERRRAREFALLLESSRPATGHELEALVALAASLHPANIVPRAEFRAALRESLVAEAAARRVATAVATKPADPQTQRHRVRTVVATGLLVSLVGGVGAAAASTHALPGDALYGLKRGLESAQLRFDHSDLSRGRDLLDQADNRLSEIESLATSADARSPETTARIAQTIADLDAATRAGARDLEASYADTGNVVPLVELDRFVVDQRQRLADLSPLLSPDQRALLSPLSELLLTLQPRLDSLLAVSAAPAPTGANGAGAQQGGAGKPPLTGSGGDVTDTINGLTGSGSSTAGAGGAVGGLGNGAGSSTLPSPVPHVSVPRSPLPSVPVPGPVPSVPVPSVPVPSVPVPSITVPSIPVPVPTDHPDAAGQRHPAGLRAPPATDHLLAPTSDLAPRHARRVGAEGRSCC